MILAPSKKFGTEKFRSEKSYLKTLGLFLGQELVHTFYGRLRNLNEIIRIKRFNEVQ